MTTDTPDRSTVADSAAVFKAYHDKVYRHVHHLVRDPIEAEDLTQETFLRAHRQLDTLKDSAALAVWLYRVATNVCYDRFRQASYRNAPEPLERSSREASEQIGTDLPDTDAPRIDDVVERGEMGACVQQYLDALTDDYRAVILLHDFQALTNPEIAEMLSCSVATVKIRLHRARKKLREALEQGCEFSRDRRGVFVCDRKAGG
jgi:RNA polymerase sigma-70 factor (ECF subfamily)